jgi:lon-related putative ATP-dependent protease
MKPEVFEKLSKEERERIMAASEALQQELQEILRRVGRWHRDTQERIRELNRTVTRTAAGGIIDDLKKEYGDCPAVVDYLDEVSADVVANAGIFLRPKEAEHLPAVLGAAFGLHEIGHAPFHRYKVNVFIEHGEGAGAPVIHEENPTHDKLIGRIEHFSQMGVLVTDFTLIKPGALHQANGGYLILDAVKVLTQPFAWEALKRALRSHEIRIESLGQMLSLVSTVTLEPEPIPLDVKVVLAGERLIFYLLHALDPEFEELFKVVADFEEDAPRSAGTAPAYAQLLGTLARKEGLRPFDHTAVARVIEESSRIAGDAEKLSVGMRRIGDLMREADYFAAAEKSKAVAATHVQQAIDAQERRAGRMRQRLQEEIQRGTLLIDTAGEKIAQVNGLSYVELGGFAFGYPSRITARVRLGTGKVINIEREVELSGPIHSKGVLILSGFLSGRYVPDRPLTLSASLVFEQSYGTVEGDSASVAELCALLSALASAPVKQSLAVTGSVDQHGRVQAIGGVSEKVEGFFDVCKPRGLSGEQGVLIPSANIKHLMLRQEIIDAVAAGKFHVYAVEHIDEAIELLTGLPAGQRGDDGKFPEGTLNYRVEQQLIEFAEKARAFRTLEGGEEAEKKHT